jgi:hypothetical protein
MIITREEFALAAMPEFIRIKHQTTNLQTLTEDDAREIAVLSYRMADAMMALRTLLPEDG